MKNFDVPILLLTFNRLSTTKKVFEEIRKIKPAQLFLVSDGPRNKGEEKKVMEVRKFLTKNVDWNCNFKKRFRDKNLGGGRSGYEAFNWFFDYVEEGIILEDDDLPNKDFFLFCKEMLDRYRNNERVMNISGYNPVGRFDVKESYFFSEKPYMWGFATWRKYWKNVDYDIYKKISEKDLRKYWPNIFDRVLRRQIKNHMVSGKIQAWDTQWTAYLKMNSGLSVIPKKSLIKNLGFSTESTNTQPNFWDKLFMEQSSYKLDFPLIHPKIIKNNKKFEMIRIFREYARKILKKVFFFI